MELSEEVLSQYVKLHNTLEQEVERIHEARKPIYNDHSNVISWEISDDGERVSVSTEEYAHSNTYNDSYYFTTKVFAMEYRELKEYFTIARQKDLDDQKKKREADQANYEKSVRDGELKQLKALKAKYPTE